MLPKSGKLETVKNNKIGKFFMFKNLQIRPNETFSTFSLKILHKIVHKIIKQCLNRNSENKRKQSFTQSFCSAYQYQTIISYS